MWIQHTPTHAVKAAFTENGDAALERYEKSDGLADELEAVTAQVSLEALLTAQEDAKNSVARTAVSAEYAVIVQDNVVDVLTLDADALEVALSEAGAELPAKARIKEISAMSAPVHGSELHGGEALSTCTSGFSVKNSSGTQGITTAGYCRRSQSRSVVALAMVEEWDGGSYDLQWHTGPSSQTVRNLVYDGTNHRYIHSGRHWDDQAAGDYVCKYGSGSASRMDV